jgi:hypothetical protein
VFSIAGAVVAAALAFYRAANLVAYHLTKNKDEKALRKLYNTLGGEKWKRREGWMEDIEDVPLKSWDGVQVDEHNTVVILDLSANGLAGDFGK